MVGPARAALAQAPPETRLAYWRRHRAALEAMAWEELCRMAVPYLHRADSALAALGPWEPAQRYWRRNEPEYDVVARSLDGRRLLVGEAKSTVRPVSRAGRRFRPSAPPVAGAGDLEIVPAVFTPLGRGASAEEGTVHVVDARTVLRVLR